MYRLEQSDLEHLQGAPARPALRRVRVAARPLPAPARAAAAALGAPARVPRALLHQEPPLLDDVHRAAPGAPRARAATRARRRATRPVGPPDQRGRVRRAPPLALRRHRLPHAGRRVARRVRPQARGRAAADRARGASRRPCGRWRAVETKGDGDGRESDAGGRAVRDGARGRGAGGAVDGHDPALLPRGKIPGRRMPGQIRPVRFLWSEVEAAFNGMPTGGRAGAREWRRLGGVRRERAARTDLPRSRAGCGRSATATRTGNRRSGRASARKAEARAGARGGAARACGSARCTGRTRRCASSTTRTSSSTTSRRRRSRS